MRLPEPDPGRERRVARAAEAWWLPWVLRSHRWSAEQIVDHQARALGRVLADARTRSPLWRSRLPADLGPGPVDRAAFAELPPIDKATVADAGEDAFTRPQPGADRAVIASSGTSGLALSVPIAGRTAQWIGTNGRAHSVHRRIRPDERGFWVRATTRRTGPRLPSPAPPQLADRIAQERPRLVGGLPHLLVEVGRELRGRHRPRWVVVGGETTSAELHEELTELFGVRPFDSYASVEVGNIGWQCRARDLYHLDPTWVLVELLDEEDRPVGPGETGDVVVTGLLHPAMPMIRYRQGDRATWADRPCRCGSEQPALARLDGRVHDWFVTPTGRVAPQRLYLSLHLPDYDPVRQYRLSQDVDGTVHLRYVASGPDLDAGSLRQVRDSYARVLPGVPVRIERVDELPPAPSGKFGQFRSELARLGGSVPPA